MAELILEIRVGKCEDRQEKGITSLRIGIERVCMFSYLRAHSVRECTDERCLPNTLLVNQGFFVPKCEVVYISVQGADVFRFHLFIVYV